MLSLLGQLCRLAGDPVIPFAGLPVSRFTSSHTPPSPRANGPTGQPANRITGQPANGLNQHGQSLVMLALLIAAVAAALVAMGAYVRRGYQGYLRCGSQAHGVQFDPVSHFTESHRMNAYTRNQTVDVISGEASVPGINDTTLPARTLTTKVNTLTTWDVSRDSHYDAQ